MSGEITADTIRAVVNQTAKQLDCFYVFPEEGKKLAQKIKDHLSQGTYEKISDPSLLGQILHQHLREVVDDRHLHIFYNPDEAVQIEKRAAEKTESGCDTHWWDQRGDDNFGLKKAEILAGNIGYLDIHVFAPVSLGADRMAAAISFLSDCDALIFDLRKCGGGDPFMVQLLESYLFGPEPKLLTSLQDRYEEKNQQLWTLPHIPGKRMPNIPVYILTSAQTFSGGEDFSYTMKHHSRATIIGENTKGGAHTIQFLSVGEGFVLVLPTGQPIHPISRGNWEGIGVSPDISVSVEEALRTAHMHALENLNKTCDNAIKADYYRAIKRRVNRSYEPLTLDAADLKPLIGNYGHYQAIVEENRLIIAEAGSQTGWEAIPLSKTRFITDDEYDIEFNFDENGEVTGLKWLEIATGKEMLAAKTR